LGWLLLFRERFWERADFLLLVLVIFYLFGFSLFYMTRRYGIPLAALSLGWVAVGFMTMHDHFQRKWRNKGLALTGVVIAAFAVGTLPKTLHAIGEDKAHLREAGLYLREKPGNPAIVTTNGRVAFYARGKNRVRLEDSEDLPSLLEGGQGDYLAADSRAFEKFEGTFRDHGWLLDREFSWEGRDRLVVLRRAGVS